MAHETLELVVEGMSCQHCVRAVRETLSLQPGVETVEVDLAVGRAKVQGRALNVAALVQAVNDEGYSARQA